MPAADEPRVMMGLTREELLGFNRRVIDELRANAGVCGGVLEGNPMLLLTTTGNRSGTPRTTPLTYHRDGERLVVMASAGGNPTDPAWYRNVVADPAVIVEIGTERYDATASTAGHERNRLFDAMVAALPRFGDYQDAVDRVIPLVVLARR